MGTRPFRPLVRCVQVCKCMDRPPLQTKVKKAWWYQEEVINFLVHTYGLSPEAWIVLFFLILYCTSSLVLGKTQTTTIFLLSPWTSHSAKFIVGKVECPKKVFVPLFNIYIYHLYIMSEGSSFIQHSAFVYNKRISLRWHPGDKDRHLAY